MVLVAVAIVVITLVVVVLKRQKASPDPFPFKTMDTQGEEDDRKDIIEPPTNEQNEEQVEIEKADY